MNTTDPQSSVPAASPASKRPKTFEEACAISGDDPVKVLPYSSPENQDQENTNAFVMLKVITKAIRGSWEPDWNNGNQPKWFPWFRMGGGSGFGFSDLDCDFSNADASAGSRLCFKTSDAALYAGKTFEALYIDWMLYTGQIKKSLKGKKK